MQLVESGRHAIDSAVAPVVDSLLDHLVIVEGYSGRGTPDQQYITSRRRADLVREYLETHFHLVHDNVGIVPLRKKPPHCAGEIRGMVLRLWFSRIDENDQRPPLSAGHAATKVTRTKWIFGLGFVGIGGSPDKNRFSAAEPSGYANRQR